MTKYIIKTIAVLLSLPTLFCWEFHSNIQKLSTKKESATFRLIAT